MLFKCSTKEKWRQISEHPLYQNEINAIKRDALCFLDNPPQIIAFKDYRRVYETGDRATYQRLYFDRRKRLDVFAFLSLLTKESRWLSELEDTIWMICDEFSWELPAHIDCKDEIQAQKNTVALFSTETAATLSEIVYLLADQLNNQVKQRVRHEVYQRVIEPFLNTPDFGWEHYQNNWVAVCTANIGISLMCQGKKEYFEQAKERLLRNMRNYIASFPQDGACAEGYGYWKLGVGCFVQFASMYAEYTADTSLLDTEKVLRIAQFQQKAFVGKTLEIPFSDTIIGPLRHDRYLTAFLSGYFPQVQPLPHEISTVYGDDLCYRWGAFIRNFLWVEPDSPQIERKIDEAVFFPQTQWYIRNTEKYSAAIKAGHNGESHNHNDIAALTVAVGNAYVIADLGSGLYTQKYFSENRYDYLVTSSRGHSVPIIDNCFQAAGKTHEGTMHLIADNEIEIDYANAYPLPYLNRLNRKVTFLPDKIQVADCCEAQQKLKSFVQRWILLQKPRMQAEGVTAGNCLLRYPTEIVQVHIGTESYTDNETKSRTVYFLDFEVRCLERKAKICTTIEIRDSVKGVDIDERRKCNEVQSHLL